MREEGLSVQRGTYKHNLRWQSWNDPRYCDRGDGSGNLPHLWPTGSSSEHPPRLRPAPWER
jgi:hypothetical protein